MDVGAGLVHHCVSGTLFDPVPQPEGGPPVAAAELPRPLPLFPLGAGGGPGGPLGPGGGLGARRGVPQLEVRWREHKSGWWGNPWVQLVHWFFKALGEG